MIKFALSSFILIFALSLPSIIWAEGELVLVTSSQSQLKSLSRKELRRVYLGLKVTKNESRVTPLRNYSNEILHEKFLQKVMFMSSRTYERQLNMRTVGKGLKPPEKFRSLNGVVSSLQSNKESVAYMWESEANRDSKIRILKIQ